MRFAVSLPWWGYVLAFGLVGLLAWAAYARVAVPLGRGARTGLVLLRAATLTLIVIALLRPVVAVPSDETDVRVVPLLIDVSRSMRIASGEESTRLDAARGLGRRIEEALGTSYRVEWLSFGDEVRRATPDGLEATADRSDLAVALEDVAERYGSLRIPGVIVLSDGGDTSGRSVDAARLDGLPVFPVGLGGVDEWHDREVLSVTAGEPLLPDAAIDISVSAVVRGGGTATQPLELRLRANGRPVDVRRVTPAADGAPVHEVFTVAPAADQPTVYTVEIPPAPGELTSDNNRRSVLVPPHVARRNVLIVEGAPGFEHTFLKRALATDPGLSVDAVVRKGQNDQGQDTFYVQAGESRAAALSTGYPQTREALFQYDAVVFGNVQADFFTREQLDLTARFVAERGGGLLVLGGRSFERRGLTGTSLEEVLPVDLTDRQARLAAPSGNGEGVAVNAPAVTDDGVVHPATRLAASLSDSRGLWRELPPLASINLVGGPRPGAQILAVTASPGGDAHPLVAVQRYGQGRSMVFAGEASWRWRMMRPAADTVYDTIWRQMVRWVAMAAEGQVSVVPMSVAVPGRTEPVGVIVRTPRFEPAADADVSMTITGPDGAVQHHEATLASPRDGRYAASVRFGQPGVYRVDAEARRGGLPLGTHTRYVLAGGADLEMSDPRVNEAALRRVAAATGGEFVPAAEVGTLEMLLDRSGSATRATELRDLWHNAWTLLAIMGLLAAEWLVRRRVGLA